MFCYACGKKEHKQCPRCLDKVSRVEQTGLGTVFMCSHGGSRYGSSGCRRTYLSARDLQAHINHRHVSNPTQPVEVVETERPLPPPRTKGAGDPRSAIPQQSGGRQRSSQSMGHQSHQSHQSSGVRTNLITVPIQVTTKSSSTLLTVS